EHHDHGLLEPRQLPLQRGALLELAPALRRLRLEGGAAVTAAQGGGADGRAAGGTRLVRLAPERGGDLEAGAPLGLRDFLAAVHGAALVFAPAIGVIRRPAGGAGLPRLLGGDRSLADGALRGGGHGHALAPPLLEHEGGAADRDLVGVI